MPLIHVLPKRRTHGCSISLEGKLSIPASILDELHWEHGSHVSLNYLLDPLTLILQRINDDSGFKLMRRASATASNPAGILTCAAFTKSVLNPRIVLPKRGISPIILHRTDPTLALMLETPPWTRADFNQSGRHRIPANIKGVYQLLDSSEEVVRIGEGVVNNRIAQHLKNHDHETAVRYVRYIPLSDKEEMELLEQILLAAHVAKSGKLPILNSIHG